MKSFLTVSPPLTSEPVLVQLMYSPSSHTSPPLHSPSATHPILGSSCRHCRVLGVSLRRRRPDRIAARPPRLTSGLATQPRRQRSNPAPHFLHQPLPPKRRERRLLPRPAGPAAVQHDQHRRGPDAGPADPSVSTYPPRPSSGPAPAPPPSPPLPPHPKHSADCARHSGALGHARADAVDPRYSPRPSSCPAPVSRMLL